MIIHSQFKQNIVRACSMFYHEGYRYRGEYRRNDHVLNQATMYYLLVAYVVIE